MPAAQTSYCCSGRCMCGPQEGTAFVAIVVCFFAVATLVDGGTHPPDIAARSSLTRVARPAVWYAASITAPWQRVCMVLSVTARVVCAVFYASTACRDPGSVGRYVASLERTTLPGVATRRGKPAAGDRATLLRVATQPDVEAGQTGERSAVAVAVPHRPGWVHCDACRMDVPPSAHHCRRCGHCVVAFDHHCAWMNNCIGLWNHRQFVLTIAFACVRASTKRRARRNTPVPRPRRSNAALLSSAVLALAAFGALVRVVVAQRAPRPRPSSHLS